MRQPMLFALALATAALAGPAAAQQSAPGTRKAPPATTGKAPAQQTGKAAPAAKPAPAHQAPAAKAPPPHRGPAAKAAPAPADAPPALGTLQLNTLAARASLDARTRARVAPHVAAMNRELAQLRRLTAGARRDAPKAEQDKLHHDLNAHFSSFRQHWAAADALLTPAQKTAFDAAVREQMGVRRRVGNPHTNLPSTHPKLDAHGGKAKP